MFWEYFLDKKERLKEGQKNLHHILGSIANPSQSDQFLILKKYKISQNFIFHLPDLKASTVRSHLYGLHILVSSAVGTLLLLYV